MWLCPWIHFFYKATDLVIDILDWMMVQLSKLYCLQIEKFNPARGENLKLLHEKKHHQHKKPNKFKHFDAIMNVQNKNYYEFLKWVVTSGAPFSWHGLP